MTKITCDKCKKQINSPIVVDFRDGEHPHNGSICHKSMDLCEDCARIRKGDYKYRFVCDMEWDAFCDL